MIIDVSQSVAQIALWLDEKLAELPFADVGVVGTIHKGRLTKVRFEQTVKEVSDVTGVCTEKRNDLGK